jgi:hypothetical protein
VHGIITELLQSEDWVKAPFISGSDQCSTVSLSTSQSTTCAVAKDQAHFFSMGVRMTLLGTLCVIYWLYCYWDTHTIAMELGPMKTNQMHNMQRVHVRALARLQQLHEEISADHFPSVRDLAVRVERHPRTIFRDLKALREDFNAPLTYDSQQKGYRYTEPGWNLSLSRTRQI